MDFKLDASLAFLRKKRSFTFSFFLPFVILLFKESS